MELKQQLKQSAAASSIAVKEPQTSRGDKQVTTLQKITKNKQQALEVIFAQENLHNAVFMHLQSVSTQLESLKEEHCRLEQQCSALKARNTYLAAELKQAKHQISNLHDKGKQDDLLISMVHQKEV